MLSKSFFGYTKPAFRYELLSTTLPQPIQVPIPETVTLLLPRELDAVASDTIKVGARVKTGQCLSWGDASGPSVIASVTGTIQSISAQTGNYGRKYTAIEISRAGEEMLDEAFDAAQADTATLARWLNGAPGGADLGKLNSSEKPIDTIVIYGGDTDILVETNLFVLKSQIDAVNQGIKALKAASGIEKVIVAVPADSFQNYDGHFHADVKAVPNAYPGGQPLMIHYRITGNMLAQGQTPEDAGVFFIRAEAVAAIGKAVTSGKVPVEKILTVVDQNGRRSLVSARLGTPIGSVLNTLEIATADGDRIIYGGPMTGAAIFSENQPVMPDSDAIMVQERPGHHHVAATIRASTAASACASARPTCR
jgi:electron transport complex protein RnfC